jgi:hypothetical protein
MVIQSVANVAQLVEQRFRKARVAGSNPVVGSNLSTNQVAIFLRLYQRFCIAFVWVTCSELSVHARHF